MNYAIIAAGEGSRLVQEGVPMPKPLVDIDGRPMIRRLIDIFMANDARRISVIVNEHMTAVRQYVEAIQPQLPIPLTLVVKTTPSSMHSFYEVSRTFGADNADGAGGGNNGDGRFILTTVDTIFREEDFARYVQAFAQAPDDIDGCMAVTTYIDDEKPLYVDTDADGIITAFRDAPWEGVRYVSGGIYGLRDAAVDILRRCIDEGVSRMRNYQRALVAAGQRLRAFDMGKILDVDHAGDIEKAREFLR